MSVITINVGGAGTRIGAAVAKQYMSEESSDVFMEEHRNGHTYPRHLMVDLDSTRLDDLRENKDERFDPDCFVSGKQDGGNNYARGYTLGREMMDVVSDKLRKLVDNCDQLDGFVVNRSMAGGTGSGLGHLILENLRVEFRKKPVLTFEVLADQDPGRTSPCQVYNQVISTHILTDHSDISLVFDNRKLRKICRDSYNLSRPTFEHVNALIARIASGVTGSIRDGTTKLVHMHTDFVPFPRLHFLTPSFADEGDAKALVSSALQMKNMTVHYPEFDPIEDKYLAYSLNFRGKVASKDANNAASWAKQQGKISFVEWVPSGMHSEVKEATIGKVGDELPMSSELSLTAVGNNVAINRVFGRNNKKYDAMYSQRAYVHHYVNEGMEEGALSEAREDLGFLEKDYLDILTEQAEDEEDDDGEF